MTDPLIETGIKDLDAALGGGLPRGGVISIDGPSSSDKSALVHRIMARAQCRCAMVDADMACGWHLAERAGVARSQILWMRPADVHQLVGAGGEDGQSHPLRQMLDLASSGLFPVVAFDSITGSEDWPGTSDIEAMFEMLALSEVTFIVTSNRNGGRTRDAIAMSEEVGRLHDLLESSSAVRIDLQPYYERPHRVQFVTATVASNSIGRAGGQVLLTIEGGVVVEATAGSTA